MKHGKRYPRVMFDDLCTHCTNVPNVRTMSHEQPLLPKLVIRLEKCPQML
jgi:hypothetical protein